MEGLSSENDDTSKTESEKQIQGTNVRPGIMRKEWVEIVVSLKKRRSGTLWLTGDKNFENDSSKSEAKVKRKPESQRQTRRALVIDNTVRWNLDWTKRFLNKCRAERAMEREEQE